MMGVAINWLAYVWLVTSEVFEEMLFSVGDFFRRIAFEIGTREQAHQNERRIYTRPISTAKATDTV
jgi:hypothetical protein